MKEMEFNFNNESDNNHQIYKYLLYSCIMHIDYNARIRFNYIIYGKPSINIAPFSAIAKTLSLTNGHCNCLAYHCNLI